MPPQTPNRERMGAAAPLLHFFSILQFSSMPTPDDLILYSGALDGPLDFARVFGREGAPARPVELEVGCGKGKFLMAAATKWPERDFLAIEYVAALVRKVRDKTVRAGLSNVRILNADATDAFERLLPPASLSRVHLYFPDPWPKRRHAKHRFIADPMADRLARVLAPGGELLLATDHDPYFREAVARLACHPAFVRTLPDPFRDIPRGGFDAIFEAAGVPAFRGIWERVIDAP